MIINTPSELANTIIKSFAFYSFYSVCAFVPPSVCLSACLPACLSVCLSMSLVFLFVFSTWLS